ncbi:MAG: hypothetical protein ACI90V_003019 [Bacillariaceae sp.]|jgi:hypothetical protein
MLYLLFVFPICVLIPYKDTLIGRQVKEEENIIKFELLTADEEQIIIPKLEVLYKEELEANGLGFSSNGLIV